MTVALVCSTGGHLAELVRLRPRFEGVEDVVWIEHDSEQSRSLREEMHRAMGPKLDAAKHMQRRKEGGLPEAVSARVAQHRAHREAKDEDEKHLRERYSIDD